MRTKNKFFLFLLTSLFFAAALSVSAASVCRSGRGGYCAELGAIVSVPGLNFIQYDNSLGIAGFIKSLYVFGMGLVGISALIVFIYAGIRYMTAGDNQNATSDAKKRMKNAMFGLTIAILSWLVLRTINPNLTTVGFTMDKINPPTTTQNVNTGATTSFDRAQDCDNKTKLCTPPLTCFQADAVSTGKCLNSAPAVSNLVKIKLEQQNKEFQQIITTKKKAGDACILSSQCETGLLCFYDLGRVNIICQPPLTEGASCEPVDQSCASPLKCIANLESGFSCKKP